ncbi:MAG: hypothetical protein M3R63_19475 [Actinomycetota bacterium]|nr:hypothetical protein [Actinomycetota bacterium]
MSSPAPTTFLAILAIALVLIVWWRATLAIMGAFLIAVLVLGLNEVMDRIDLEPSAVIVTDSPVGPPPGDDGNAPGP